MALALRRAAIGGGLLLLAGIAAFSWPVVVAYRENH